MIGSRVSRLVRLVTAGGAVAIAALSLTSMPASAAGAEVGAIATTVHLAPYPCTGPQAASPTNLLNPNNTYSSDCSVTPVALASVAAGTAGTGVDLVGFNGAVSYDEPCPGPVEGGAWGQIHVGSQNANFQWFRVGLTAVITLFDNGQATPSGGGAAVFAPLPTTVPGSCLAGGALDAAILSVAVDS